MLTEITYRRSQSLAHHFVQCSGGLDHGVGGYPFSPGHYVTSITYRESLMALPGQGQLIDLR